MARIAFLALLLSLAPALVAQETALTFDHRVAGDRAMTIQMGPVLPLFYQSLSGAFTETKLTPGGSLGLDVDFYLDGTLRLGGGIKGMAAFSPSGHTLFVVPLMFRTTWEFRTFPWSFPVGFSAGVAFTSYNQHTWMDPFLMPTAGAYWNLNPSWSFGVDASYWWMADLYFGNPIPASDSRLANFLDLALGAVYHF
jgi:hypothetical protein